MKKLIPLLLLICFGCQNNTEKKDQVQQVTESNTNQQGVFKLVDSVSLCMPPSPVCKKDTSTIALKNEILTYEQAYNQALTLWQLTFEEVYIKTSFGKAHVLVCGPKDGEPMVLLHGMDASSTMWYPNIKSLAKQYRVYAIDFLLEPGKSVCLEEIKHTNQIIDWYYEIFDDIKLKKFNIIGASRGGWLAINIALHDKARIKKMALLSPAQTFAWIKLGPQTLFNIAYSIFPKRKKFRNVMETMTVDIDNISQIYLNQYYLATKKGIFHKCFLQMTPFSDKDLKTLKMPILVLIGDHDIINSAKSLKRAKKVFSNLMAEEVKNSGHFLSFDQAELINKKLLDFFNR